LSCLSRVKAVRAPIFTDSLEMSALSYPAMSLWRNVRLRLEPLLAAILLRASRPKAKQEARWTRDGHPPSIQLISIKSGDCVAMIAHRACCEQFSTASMSLSEDTLLSGFYSRKRISPMEILHNGGSFFGKPKTADRRGLLLARRRKRRTIGGIT
jgi:hypothetical protein